MAAEASAGMNQQLTLDHPSFEKLLAAAWVLQCLHDQLHNPQIGSAEAMPGPGETRNRGENESPVLRVVIRPVGEPPPRPTEADSEPRMRSGRPADGQTLAKLVESQAAVETRSLNLKAAEKVEFGTVKREPALHSDGAATVPSTKPALSVWQKPSHIAAMEKARPRTAFSYRITDLRSAIRPAWNAFTSLRPAFRLRFALRTLRTLAMATPVLLPALLAALLLVETWRHQPLHSAQATSRANVLVAETTPTTRAASSSNKRITTGTPGPISRSGATHKQVTDQATLSVVQELSKYEIRRLRRQAHYGDAAAAFTLGMAYEVGRHVPQNCGQAARWVKTAAKAGNAAAQYNLGMRYLEGDGVPADRMQSEKWLRQAAAHRTREARLALKILAAR
jgi:hypothetical protein